MIVLRKTSQYRSVHVDTMCSPFTKETQEFTKRSRGKVGTDQSKIKRKDIFGKRRGTGEEA